MTRRREIFDSVDRCIRIERDLMRKINRIAKQQNKSASKVIRESLVDAVNAHHKKQGENNGEAQVVG